MKTGIKIDKRKIMETDIKNKITSAALIMCAGNGSRSGLSYNKVLHYLGKKTVLEQALDSFSISDISHIIIVCSEYDLENIKSIASLYDNTAVIIGGQTRTESVRNGLKAAKTLNCDVICIHDGARPYISHDIINESIKTAYEFGSAIVAVPVIDTIKEIKNSIVEKTLDRDVLYSIQTPQSFRAAEIISAYEKIDGNFTDDSAVYEKAGYKARIIKGDYSNIKITTPQDLYNIKNDNIKIGAGFDVHQLTSGRKLILGGVEIPHITGLLGHSDADVLVHAVMDALLSAANLPDIGVNFPDTDNKFKDADSIMLLKQVADKIYSLRYKIGNISAVIMAQKPKLSPFIPQMQKNIAAALNISDTLVTVSATTAEKLGIVGKEEGMASSASCILISNS